MTDSTRERNRRGEGSKLREEILAAAAGLLERDGHAESVTLRAVAREVGISAPSIYGHFEDREAIVSAVIDAAFSDFLGALRAVIVDGIDPVEQLRRIGHEYLAFAAERPHRYRLLFDRLDLERDHRPRESVREDSFTVLSDALQSCVDAGRSTSTDILGDATAIWASMHGYATLRASITHFPWPQEAIMLDKILHGLAGTTEPAS
jgi:AcrR family transcriptional regulator